MLQVGIGFAPWGSTYGRYGADKFRRVKQLGYDAVDYDISDTNTQIYLSDEETQKQVILEEKLAAQDAGIRISQIHGPWRYPPQDGTDADRAERLDKMKTSVRIAAMLACQYVVVHPIMPYGIRDLEIDKGKETWDLNLAFFKELAAYAKQYDVVICLENMPMPYFSLATPEQILTFVQTVDEENLQICLDTGHVAVFPDLAVGDEVRRLGSYIKVLHIHDNLGNKDAHLYPTEGITDWHGFLKAIDEIGFGGVLSLETAPSGALDDEAFAQEGIRLYQLFKDLINRTSEEKAG